MTSIPTTWRRTPSTQHDAVAEFASFLQPMFSYIEFEVEYVACEHFLGCQDFHCPSLLLFKLEP